MSYDEAVEAAAEAIGDVLGFEYSRLQNKPMARAAIAAALPHLKVGYDREAIARSIYRGHTGDSAPDAEPWLMHEDLADAVIEALPPLDAGWQGRVNEMLERLEQVQSTWGFPVEQPAPQADMAADWDPDALTVCTVHRRFIPCRPCMRRKDEEPGFDMRTFWTQDAEAVRVVREWHSEADREQPAPTVAPSVDEIAAVIRDWLLDHLPPHRPEPMAEAVAAADPRRTEAEVREQVAREIEALLVKTDAKYGRRHPVDISGRAFWEAGMKDAARIAREGRDR